MGEEYDYPYLRGVEMFNRSRWGGWVQILVVGGERGSLSLLLSIVREKKFGIVSGLENAGVRDTAL